MEAVLRLGTQAGSQHSSASEDLSHSVQVRRQRTALRRNLVETSAVSSFWRRAGCCVGEEFFESAWHCVIDEVRWGRGGCTSGPGTKVQHLQWQEREDSWQTEGREEATYGRCLQLLCQVQLWLWKFKELILYKSDGPLGTEKPKITSGYL